MNDKLKALADKKVLLRKLLEKQQSNLEKNDSSDEVVLQPVSRDQLIPLSYSQRRLWLYEEKNSAGLPTYNMPVALQLEGELDVEALAQAFTYILKRHESLRTRFPAAPGEQLAQQEVLPAEPYALSCHTITKQALSDAIAQHAQAPFDLQQGPLLKTRLLRLADKEYVLLFNQHHIITDGWSQGILLRELMQAYHSYSQSQAPVLPALKIQYADYAYWQNQQDSRIAEQYWEECLQDYKPDISLPVDKVGQATQSTACVYKQQYPSALSTVLSQFCQKHNVSLFMGLLTAMSVVLQRYSQNNDICIGTTTAGRQHSELEGLIGFFINIVALRIEIGSRQSGLSLLQQIKKLTLEAYEHGALPFEDVLSISGQQGDALLPVIIRHQNFPDVALGSVGGELKIRQLQQTVKQRAKCALDFGFYGQGDDLSVVVEYAGDLFNASTIERLIEHHQQILRALVSSPDQLMINYELLTQQEQRQLLPAAPARILVLSEQPSVLSHFAQQVQAQPQAIAVYTEDGQALDYVSLNRQANRLAAYLQDQGINIGDRVALCLPRSADYLSALLAIWRVGAVYVPLDPDYPSHYLQLLIDDAQPTLVLSCSDVAGCVEFGDIIYLDQLTLVDAEYTPVVINASYIAYIMYTSGSTGRPKGVMVPHQQLQNWLQSLYQQLPFAPDEVVAQKTTAAFAVSMKEMLAGLLAGCPQVIVSNATAKDSQAFLKVLQDYKVTRLNIVPSHLQALLWELKDNAALSLATLRYCITAGEPLTQALLGEAQQQLPQVELWNNYGCTEINDISYYRADQTVADQVFVPIGEAIANSRVYVLDKHYRPVPTGVVGQVYVDSASVSYGYWQRASLTAESYIPHLYSDTPGARLYATGDMARYLADGSLEYMSREDFQIKIRGNRIDVRQVEKVLTEIEGVQQGVVAAWSAGDEPAQLVAYYVLAEAEAEAEAEAGISVASLRQALQAALPDFMVPSLYTELPSLPRLANGKLDRLSLPVPDLQRDAQAYVAPETETEQQLLALCETLLSAERISIMDNFLTLGGHSLLATRLVSQLRAQQNVDISLRDVFEAESFRELAQRIEHAASSASLIPLLPIDRDQQIPLSYSQRRLWLFEQNNEQQLISYNMPVVLSVQGNVSAVTMQSALDYLSERHEVLRTVFSIDTTVDEGVVQRILPTPVVVLEEDDVSDITAEDLQIAVLRARASEHASRYFDITQGPLMSVCLIKTGAQESVLLFNQHHIISDGWSVGVLLRELLQAYDAFIQGNAPSLPDLPIQYADYAHWQHQHDLSVQRDYWQSQLKDVEPGLSLPYDRLLQPGQVSKAKWLYVPYAADLGAGIARLNQRYGTSLFMVLLAAMSIVLQRYTQKTDICIGTTTAGRDRAELEGVLGFFVNIMALRLDMKSARSGAELLQQARQVALQAFEHAFIPFEDVLAGIEQRGDALVPVMLRHQNYPDATADVESEYLTVNAVTVRQAIAKQQQTVVEQEAKAKCELDFAFYGEGESLYVVVEYASDLFDEATVARMVAHHGQALGELIDNIEAPIQRYNILSAQERQQLLPEKIQGEIALAKEPSVLDRFTLQLAQQSDKIACYEENGRKVSYADLDRHVNQLAHYFVAQGVQEADRIALCLPRSIDYLAGLLAIWKLGAVYIPLDPDYPAQYLRLIIDDAQPTLVLTTAQYQTALQAESVQASVKCCLLEQITLADYTATFTAQPINPERLAYIMYTSGSTGRPKGVMVPHRQLQNWLYTLYKRLPFEEDEVVAQKTTAAFAVSMKEMLAGLLAGCPQVIVSNATAKDSQAFLKVLQDYKVTRLNIVPSHLQALLWELKDNAALSLATLRYCITAGEPLTQALLGEAQQQLPQVELWNNYGCTEINDISYYRADQTVADQVFVPIGEAIANSRVYVLDVALRAVPVGVVGTIYVDSGSLSHGYWQQPGMTAEHYIPHPYSDKPGARLYNTGDMARYLADGSLEYMNREDFQIKVRGNRIDVRQVERVLADIDGVKQGVVAAWSADAEPAQLVAYYVLTEEASLNVESLRESLQAVLPDFMVPSLYTELPSLPQLANGKLDRLNLPVPEGQSLFGHYQAPVTVTEKTLVTFCEDLLSQDKVSVSANFFHIGGHSLLATRLVSQIRSHFQVDIALRDIFDLPDLRSLAKQIERAGQSEIPALLPAEEYTGVLSYAQQRLWVVDQIEQGSPQYNMPAALMLTGDLDVAALQATLEKIVERHSVLRSVFVAESGEAKQVVKPVTLFHLEQGEIEVQQPEQERQAIQAAAYTEAQQPFDLSQDCMLRARLLRCALSSEHNEVRHALLLTMHHIAGDGWSLGLIVQEMSVLYEAYSLAKACPLSPLPVQYSDYAQWQRSWLQGDKLAGELQYWQATLAGIPQVHALPLDYPRPARQSYKGALVEQSIDSQLLKKLKILAQDAGVTLFMLLQSAYAVLMHRYSGQGDIVIGTPIANREQAEVEPLIGFFVNNLVLRSDISDNPTFLQLLQRNKETILSAYAHQQVPFESIVEALQPERDMSYSPVFQLVFALQNNEIGAMHLGDLQLSPLTESNPVAKYDLSLDIYEEQAGLLLRWIYAVDLFNGMTIQQWGRHFETLLQNIVTAPTTAVSQLALLQADEQAQLLAREADIVESYPVCCIHEMFEAQVAAHPAATALRYVDDSISYAELNIRSNRLAHYLLSQGVRPDQLIGLCFERSVDMLVAVLAVLKAGGAYVPLDPAYPKDRLQFIVDDTALAILLTQTALQTVLDFDVEQICCLDDAAFTTALLLHSDDNPQATAHGLTPAHLAYVIYTSGSTGKPKGVLVEHRHVSRLLRSTESLMGFNEQDVWSLFHSYAFDFSVWEIWGALCYGGCLVIVPKTVAQSSAEFYRLLHTEKVTILNQTPTAFNQLIMQDGEQQLALHLKKIIFGGEALNLSALSPWVARHSDEQVALINMYGITETTVHVTYRRIRRKDIDAMSGSVIGEPLPDLRLYLLDPYLMPVPNGMAGELFVGGAGVTRGYLNRADLTAERFIENPYKPGELLYRSGDLARRMNNGELEYQGRIDHQVKIRGFRIELGEIEAALLGLPGIQEVAVVDRDNAMLGKQLVAYIVAEEDQQENWRAALKSVLPDYMVPSAFMLVDQIPLTTNGKLDRKALPAPDFSVSTQTYIAPETAVEKAIVLFCEELLEQDSISVLANFFHIGGHSLLATRLVARINAQWSIAMSLVLVFEVETLRELAQQVEMLLEEEGARPATLALQAVSRAQALPLSFSQRRLWLFEQGNSQKATSYNMAFAVRLHGALSYKALNQAFTYMLGRHETLRTYIAEDAMNKEPTQVVMSPFEMSLPCLTINEQDLEEHVQAHGRIYFDINQGPLFSARLLQLNAEEHVLVFNHHHIISDGWSISILLRELMLSYDAFVEQRRPALPALSVQYADYAFWQHQQDLGIEKNYWQTQLADYEAGLSLPYDRALVSAAQRQAKWLEVRYAPELSEAITRLSRQQQCSIFMTLLAAMVIVLQRYTDRDDLCLGTTTAGRSQAELEGLIGFFINVLALRFQTDADMTGKDFLKYVKKIALQAFEKSLLPFEDVLSDIGQRGNEFVPVMIRHQNFPDIMTEDASEYLQLTSLQAVGEKQQAKCDLDFAFYGEGDGIYVIVEYDSGLFDEATIARLVDHHKQVLAALIEYPEKAIADYDILSKAEYARLLPAQAAKSIDLSQQPDILSRFAQQVQAQPQAIAVYAEDGQALDYASLNRQANRLAAYLQDQGINIGDRVALCLPRSADYLSALLAIWRVGAVYVPLDPDYPSHYLQLIIDDAQPTLILSHSDVADCIEFGDIAYLDQLPLANDVADIPIPISAAHVAYIMYTSGSTGRPKGVMVPHQQLQNWLQSLYQQLPFAPDEVVAQKTTAAFAVSMKEMLAGLLAGCPQVIVSNATAKDSQAFLKVLQDYKVTRLNIVPSHLQALLWELKDNAALSLATLRYCITAGEPLTQALLGEAQQQLPQVELWNNYGCTEINDISYYRADQTVADQVFVPIGEAIANSRVYVLDKHYRPVPTGVVGQVYVDSASVSYGYWQRASLTAESYIPHLYSDTPGARLYATGDMARYLADGSLEYMSREDFQIKIRGNRIDVRQVEKVLTEIEGVQQGVVAAWSAGDEPAQLVAYYVLAEAEAEAEAEAGISVASLRQALQAALPDFMVPSLYTELPSLPRLANGKLDRLSLPVPEGQPLFDHYAAPVTLTEKALVAFCEDLLSLDKVSISANFFHIGGHSLLATRLISQIRSHFQVDIALRDMFDLPDLRSLAKQIELADQNDIPPLLAAEEYTGVLSYAQQRLWVLDQIEQGSPQYNMPVALMLTGDLDVAALQAAFSTIVDRHSVLRSIFIRQADEAKQQVRPVKLFKFEQGEIKADNIAGETAEIKATAYTEAQRPFDLSQDCMLRVKLLRCGLLSNDNESRYLLLITMHHIASDGWSLGMMVKELETLYAAYADSAENALPDLPDLTVQYSDYAQWQRSWLQGDVLANKLAYWRKQLSGLPDVHNLPLDKPRPARQSYAGGLVVELISTSILNKLNALAKQENVTLFMLLQTAFSVLMHRYSGEADIVVGTPIANREQVELESLIGFFMNNLVLRSTVDAQQAFTALLQHNKAMILAAYANQQVSFESVVNELQPERSLSYSPLFQVLFTLHNTGQLRLDMPGVQVAALEGSSQAVKYDLALDIFEVSEGVRLEWSYASSLFHVETVARLAKNYITLLQNIVASPAMKVGELSLLSQTEKAHLLAEFNQTQQAYPQTLCLHQLIEQSALKYAADCALVAQGQALSYRELNTRANQLAHYLINERQVVPDTLVGICLPRTADMVIAVLAVMKAGGAYVPLDPSYPASRLAHMLDDAGLQTVITEHALLASMPFNAEQALCLDEAALQQAIAENAVENPSVEGLSQNNLAYVIYTSGSTGKPKGVMIEHRNAVNFLLSMQAEPGLQADDCLLAVTTLSFDIHVLELYLPLISGAQLIIASQEESHDPVALINLLDAHAITIMQATPATWQMLCNSDWQVTQPLKVLCGGEALSEQLKTRLLSQPHISLWNMYGPTETTVWSSVSKLTPNAPTVVGGPIANTTFYVLDRHHQVVPMGVAGELYIGGHGVARGYLNRSPLTAEKFVSDPFAADTSARLYRTGDLVSWLPDGTLKFLGRIDHQVKIRGFRIELGEIETALLALASISEAVVIDWDDGSGSKQLVAYCVAREGGELNIDATRQALRERLPEYMVPTLFMALETLPKHPNGKLNRKALPTPDRQATVEVYIAPESDVEKKLITICESLLAVENISIATDFFTLGGHSLLATRLVSQIRSQFNVDIVLRDVFEASSFRELAQRIESAGDKVDQVPLVQVDRQQKVPLSYAQRRLWLFEQNNEARLTSYNMPTALSIEGDLSVQVLQQALDCLVRRHEILRTTFCVDHSLNEGVMQVISPASSLALEVEDFSLLMAEDELLAALRERARQHAAQYFDIEAGPLLSLCLIKTSKPYSVLLFNQHHIISDGWSVRIMLSELMQAYDALYEERQPELVPISIQYADYAHWQHAHDLTVQSEYWQKQLSEYEAGISLPYDRPATADGLGAAKWLYVEYPATLGKGMAQLNKHYGTSLFMVLLTAMTIVLQRYTQKTDICVGTTSAGREHAELEKILGFFINILPLRILPSDAFSGTDLLRQVRQVALAAFENALLPFEDTLAATGHRGDQLVPVMLRHQNYPDAADEGLSEYLKLNTINQALAEQQAKCEIDFAFYGEGKDLYVVVEYAGDLFDEATIRRMVAHHQQVLSRLISDIDVPLNDIDILTSAEQEQLLPVKPSLTKALFEECSVIQRFAEQVLEKNDAVACYEVDGKQISYTALDRYSNQLANYFSEQGVQVGDHIALCIPRSIDYIASLLAIWKLGAVYIPLDPDYPAQYLQLIIADAQPKLVLITAESPAELQAEMANNVSACMLSDIDFNVYASTLNAQPINPEQLAYIMYTSGSTGKPKGVMVPHRQLLNWLYTLQTRLPFSADEVVAQKTTAAFAVSVKELLAGLLAGCAQVIISNQIVKDSQALLKVIAQYKVTRINLVPSHLQALLWELKEGEAQAKDLQSLRYCITAGEPLTQALVEQVYASMPWLKVLNNYGCTELNDISYHTVEAVDLSKVFVPIGKPIENSRVYILDRVLRAVPLGVVGNIYVDSASISHGYWQRSSLTAEHYIPHPYSDEPGARLYNTGDMARYLADGSLEYMSREDFQIKIRGNRIDVRQVEKVLNDVAGIQQAVVSAQSMASGPAQLVAYYTEAELDLIDVNELRTLLQMQLPDFMVPGLYMALKVLPKLPNGKLDRRSLPTPDTLLSQNNYVAPNGATEQALAKIWQHLLSLEQVSANANFFNIGGHSLMASRLITEVREHWQMDVDFKAVFDYPVLSEFAVYLDKVLQSGEASTFVDQSAYVGPIHMTNGQRWFFDMQYSNHHHWNVCSIFECLQSMDSDSIEQALLVVANHHDILRSQYTFEDGEWHAEIQPLNCTDAEFSQVELAGTSLEAANASTDELIAALQGSLNIEDGPSWRIVLMKYPGVQVDNRPAERLFFLFHHLLCDVSSMMIIINDFVSAYLHFKDGQALRLPRKTASVQAIGQQFYDYQHSDALWQEYLNYWLPLVNSGRIAKLPIDFDRPLEQNIETGRSVELILSEAETEKLRTVLPSQTDAQLFDVLLFALTNTICAWANSDLCHIKVLNSIRGSGAPMLGGLDITRSVTWLAMTQQMLLSPEYDKDVLNALAALKQQVLELPGEAYGASFLQLGGKDKNTGLPIESFLRDYLMINYLGEIDFSVVSLQDVLTFSRKSVDGNMNPDNQRGDVLTVTCLILAGRLHIIWDYSEQLHKEQTIKQLKDTMYAILQSVLARLS